jgi:hypothetical protein
MKSRKNAISTTSRPIGMGKVVATLIIYLEKGRGKPILFSPTSEEHPVKKAFSGILL